jgi:hypothetical protein
MRQVRKLHPRSGLGVLKGRKDSCTPILDPPEFEDEDDDENDLKRPVRAETRIEQGYLLAECRYLGLRENQRNPVTANNTRFRISGQSVPVFSTDRPKQPQSMFKPRTIALSNAPENIASKIANQTSAPLSQRPNKRQIPTHSSKAGRKTANAAVPGQGVS